MSNVLHFARRWGKRAACVCATQSALLYFSTSASAADAPTPPPPPATAPVQAPPSPKACALAFVAALDKADAPAAKALLPADETHAKWVDASIALSAALKKLDTAAVAKFNEAGKIVSQNQLHLADSFKSLEKAQEKIEGDTATLTIPGQAKPIQLTKVGNKWLLQIGPKDARELALYPRLTKAATLTADEIAAGTHASAQVAAKVFATRVLEARLAN